MCTVQLDLSFYQKILRNFEQDSSIELVDLSRNEACAQGSNFVGVVWRVFLTGKKLVKDKKEDYQISLIEKEIPENEYHRNVFSNCKAAFSNEALSYQDIIPNLSKYSTRPIAVPKCIFANKNCTILEDLSVTGFLNVDKLTGFDIERTTTVLKELANLHAASLVFQETDPTLFDTLINKHQNMIDPDHQFGALNLAIELLSQEAVNNKKSLQVLHALKLKGPNILVQVLSKSRKYCVINHGDLWANNILINKNNAIKFLDLQNMNFCSPAADLSYFLYINLEPEINVTSMNSFLDIYLQELRDNIQSKNNEKCKFIEELTVDWLQNEMMELSVHGFISALWISPVFYSEPDQLAMTEENMQKWKSMTLQDTLARMNPEHKQRIVNLIKLFINRANLD